MLHEYKSSSLKSRPKFTKILDNKYPESESKQIHIHYFKYPNKEKLHNYVKFSRVGRIISQKLINSHAY